MRIVDDYGIDFTSYRFTIEELNKTIDLPTPGMLGREYEQDVTLSTLADNAVLLQAGKATIDITVADDAGQVTTIQKIIKIKVPEGTQFIQFDPVE